MEGYEYLGVKIGIKFDESVKKYIMMFLGDYLNKSDSEDNISFTVSLIGQKSNRIESLLEHGSKTTLFNSNDHTILETGLYMDVGFERLVYNLSTNGVYCLNNFCKTVEIYNKDKLMLIQDAINVCRSLLKSIVEKEKNSVMYHGASVLSSNGQGILLIGDKSVGKTTLSLKLMYEHGFSEVSRDRVFITRTEDGFDVYGWPTYYNLTLNTIKQFNETQHLFPKKYSDFDKADLENVDQKIKRLLADDIKIVNKVKKCALTNIVYLINKNTCHDRAQILSKNCFSYSDTSFTNWHNCILDKSTVYQNCIEMTNDLLKFDNSIFVEKEKHINTAVNNLITKIGIG